jgi:hypothetical protein
MIALLIAWNYSDDVGDWKDLLSLSFALWVSVIGGTAAGGIIWLTITRHRSVHKQGDRSDTWLNRLRYFLNFGFFLMVIWSAWAVLG